MNVIPIVLGGGAGARLWPLTQSNKSKPMLELPNGNTLLCETYQRAARLAGSFSKKPTIVTTVNHEHFAPSFEEASKTLPNIIDSQFIVEPEAKDTAPAIVTSALHLIKTNKADALMFIMPADHCMQLEAFMDAAVGVVEIANNDKLVSIGVEPQSASDRYGYMKVVNSNIVKFIEKPSRAKAKEFLKSGHFVWNTGLFCCKAYLLIDLIKRHEPQLVEQCQRALDRATFSTNQSSKLVELERASFEKIAPISIDHALMNRLKIARCVQADMQWSDVGSWDSYSELFHKDADGNLFSDTGFAEESNNCSAFGSDRPIALLGLNNVIVVDTKDGVLVANKNHSQQVKKIRERFKERKNEKRNAVEIANSPPCENRPWGRYEVLSERKGYKVKRLIVEPYQELSLQSHEFRAEHWMVVEGSAEVQLDKDRFPLLMNEYVDIPCGAKHRISNPNADRLVFIETQTGTYLGEDDEVRYEDRYGRVN